MVSAEILIVGNEILLGLIEDTNSNYLCRLVRGMGGRVRQITVVPDEIDAVAEALRVSLNRSPEMIFTCGGLGPTDDDLTLAGLAKSIGRKLEVNPDAKEFVERRYRDLESQGHVSSVEMTAARLKMATLPEGASPIENPVGAAPAVLIDFNETRILSLPGVPAEMKAVVEGPLQSLLTAVFGTASYGERELVVSCGDESELAPILRHVADMNPGVYIKSRAKEFGADPRFRILISSSGPSAEEADRLIEKAASDLTHLLRDAGIIEPPHL